MQITLDIPKELLESALQKEVEKALSLERSAIEATKNSLRLITYAEASELLGVTYNHFQANIAGKQYSYKEGRYTKKGMIGIVNMGSKCKRVSLIDLAWYLYRKLSPLYDGSQCEYAEVLESKINQINQLRITN